MGKVPDFVEKGSVVYLCVGLLAGVKGPVRNAG